MKFLLIFIVMITDRSKMCLLGTTKKYENSDVLRRKSRTINYC
jgi:hypothetical protein